MATTNFIDGSTVIVADWLNDVDAHVYNEVLNPHPQYTTDAEASALDTAAIAAHAAQLAASNGSSLIGFKQASITSIDRTVETKLQEYVSVKDFGAVGDGVTDDTAAFLAATTAHPYIIIPSGEYVLSDIIFPVTLKGLIGFGKSTILTGSATIAGTTWMSFNFQDDLQVGGFEINLSSSVYPTVVAMQFGAINRPVIENIHVVDGGRFPIYLSNAHGPIVRNIHAENYAQSCIVAENGSENVNIDRVIATKPGTGNCIVITGGSYHNISNCFAGGAGASFFTIALIQTQQSTVHDCIAIGTTLEAIQITDGSFNRLLNNHIFCGVGHNDFGISIFGDTVDIKGNQVIGNVIIGAGGSGIGVSANHISVKKCYLNEVANNLIINPNQKNDADGAGVYLLGGTGCFSNTIQNNVCVDESNKMRYGAYESALGGNPDNNRLMFNSCFGGAVFISEGKTVGSASGVWDLDWQSFATTVSAQSGTITTVNTAATYLKYKRAGKEVAIEALAVITTNGTGGSSVQMSLPFTILGGILAGRENGVSGAMLQGHSGGTNLLRIATYVPGYPGANGAQCQVSGIVRI